MEVVNSVTLERPFCAQCESAKEDKIRERYVGIEREILQQGACEKWQIKDVEVALEICQREYRTMLAKHRSRIAILGDDFNARYKRASELNSTDQDTTHDTKSPPSENQATGYDRDDIDTIVDAYLDDDINVGSVTGDIAGMYK